VTRALDVLEMDGWPDPERRAFRSLCLLMALVQHLDRWPRRDKSRLVALMRAKGAPNEQGFFDRTIGHARFRQAMARVASSG